MQILTLARLLPGAGLGAFCTRKPRPVEYQRDVRAPGQGWLTQGECEEAWDARMPWSQYAIGIELTGDWYRDEVGGGWGVGGGGWEGAYARMK